MAHVLMIFLHLMALLFFFPALLITIPLHLLMCK